MRRAALFLALCCLLLAGCGGTAPSSVVPAPAPVPTANSSPPTAAPTRGWPLPGLPATLAATHRDFVDGFARADLASLSGQGLLIRSGDPAHPRSPGRALLLSVDATSPSVGVRFASDVLLGPLQYEPFAHSGLPLATAPTSKRKPARNVHFTKNYCLPPSGPGSCAQVGRATGIVAYLTPDSIRSETRGFTRATDEDFGRAYGGSVALCPPGYLTGKKLTQAGHLLAYVLGGPVKDPRNFVTQWDLANAPAQSAIENEVKDRLSAPGTSRSDYVLYRVTPVYQGNCVVPYDVRIQASGSGGWELTPPTDPIAASWIRFEQGPAGIAMAIVRNAEQAGGTWRVPGQDPSAQCVPPGYASGIPVQTGHVYRPYQRPMHAHRLGSLKAHIRRAVAGMHAARDHSTRRGRR